jgi:hypothetical protein
MQIKALLERILLAELEHSNGADVTSIYVCQDKYYEASWQKAYINFRTSAFSSLGDQSPSRGSVA